MDKHAITAEQMKALTEFADKSKPQTAEKHTEIAASRNGSGHLDVNAYLAAYGREVVREVSHKGGTLYCLEACVFDETHSSNEAAIFQDAEGKLSYQCFHNGCKGHTWSEARKIISGDASLGPYTVGKKQAPKNSRFKCIKAEDLEMKPADYIIDETLEADTLASFYGDTMVCKSFLAIDMGLCIASGKPFHGHSVKQGPVLYVAGEGHGGLSRRFNAWSIRHQVPLNGLPIYVSNGPAQLCDPDNVDAVIEAAKEVTEEWGEPLKMIVFDTVARNFGPGNENSTPDMVAFVAALDNIRIVFGCTVLLVHHVGQENKNRARGNRALVQAVDAEYRVEKDAEDIVRVWGRKMKEAPLPEPMALQMRQVELGIQDDQEREVTSVILDPVDYTEPENKTPDSRMGANENAALEILYNLHEQHEQNLVKGNIRKQWAIGDWLADGKRHYGDGLYKEAAQVLGYSQTSLRDFKYISDNFKMSLRHDKLGWSHHKEVSSLKQTATEANWN